MHWKIDGIVSVAPACSLGCRRFIRIEGTALAGDTGRLYRICKSPAQNAFVPVGDCNDVAEQVRDLASLTKFVLFCS
jgi:hypothetical protein